MFPSSHCPQNDSKKKKNGQNGFLGSKPEFPLNSMKKPKKRQDLKGKSQTKFEEFLEMEKASSVFSAEEDAKTLRRLAKQLKVKNGMLGDDDDGLNSLFEGLPSGRDVLCVESVSDHTKEYADEESLKVDPVPSNEKSKKHKKGKMMLDISEKRLKEENTAEMDGGDTKKHSVLLPEEEPCVGLPALDATVKYVAPHIRASQGGESEELSQVRRRIRGLLNRLSESNVESITGEVATIFRSIGRSVACQIIGDEVLASCSGGPRGNEQYAAVLQLLLESMACLVGIDFSARLLASLAKSFEEEYLKDDNLSLRNLTLLLSYLCIFGICSSDLIYDFLLVLSKRLTELDVSTILTLLQCCGMKLRDAKSKINSKRMEFMLETICDIKNNKKRPKEDSAQHTRIKKWLQKLRVEDILLRGLKWGKLLDPEKKGQWWLSGEIASTADNVEDVAVTINKEILETQKLVQLAASQRMNTDIRRAIFCIIMSGEDYVDAFEKILRLDLSGKQDREVMRVLVDCCLQEKVFNKYYTVLASKLCSHDKNHKFSLQYCLWDHFKELESMELHQSVNLARFVAEMISSFTLSLSLLKTVDLMDLKQLTPKRIMHFRILFETIFENSNALVWNIFTRLAVIPELDILRDGIQYFIKQYVMASNSKKSLAQKFKIALKKHLLMGMMPPRFGLGFRFVLLLRNGRPARTPRDHCFNALPFLLRRPISYGGWRGVSGYAVEQFSDDEYECDFEEQKPSSSVANIDEWRWKLSLLLRNTQEQEIISRDKRDRRDYEQISNLAKRMGLYSELYGKVVVASKVPLPNYRPDLDEKRPQREVVIPLSLQRRVEDVNLDENQEFLVDDSVMEKILQRKSSRMRNLQRSWQESPEGVKMLHFRKSLPAYKEKEKLLSAIARNQVIIISGKLVVKRVSAERGENLGESVGYKVRLEGMKGKNTHLLFCTSGILLRRLLGDRNLNGITHVFVDEIHERGMNEGAHFFLKNRKITFLIVIESFATLNAELFSNFFGGAPTIHIPGFTYPVRAHFLEDVLEKTGYKLTSFNQIDDYGQEKLWKTQRQLMPRKRKNQITALVEDALKISSFESYSSRARDSLASWSPDCIGFNLIEAVLCHLCRKERPGAVLVFMTGWDDISCLRDQLKAHPLLGDPNRVLLLTCHGSMATSEQKLIFEKAPPNVRKIVLATNMAEASITINDIVFVVDCGKAKETTYDALNNTPCLLPSWISKASAQQRRGRAGRVQPGECYHLYPRCVYDAFAEYQLPELLRTPLNSLCLQIKSLQLGTIGDFLSAALQPPEPLAVQNAIEFLKMIGALDDKENLTNLGRFLSMLPVDPKLGKMLIMGAVFHCLDPILTVVSGLSVRDPFLLPQDKKDLAGTAKSRFSAKDYSDHMALVRAYEGWKDADREGSASQYCWRNFLSPQTLQAINSLRKQFHFILKDAGLLNADLGTNNSLSCNQSLVRAIICSGLFPGISSVVHREKSMSFKTLNDGQVLLYANSVNARYQTIPYPWLVFGEKVKVNTVFIRDSTGVSDSILILFGGALTKGEMAGHLKMLDGYLDFFMDPSLAECFWNLKNELDRLLQRKIYVKGGLYLAEAKRARISSNESDKKNFLKDGMNPKSLLQTLLMRAGHTPPKYKTKHLKTNEFRAIVEFKGMQFVGKPKKNKQLAERDAAIEALAWLTHTSDTSHQDDDDDSPIDITDNMLKLLHRKRGGS
ncbi:hypothetical protein J5N97_009974 [Dioscorea zingiberensis]|uniref:Uncharacterized protein n=1 Tax=Dioscorea zingiberensis TaxID=325984 RepID=A0A9D5CZ87_9LILI|nr:hypothetical protein J5N97_009974 [Dioscorea zingiberensis]